MTGGKKAYYRSIPRSKDPAQSLPALTENIEILTGSRGDGMDKAVTRRELIGTGAFKFRPGNAGSIGGGSGSLVPVPVTPDGVDYPTKPENVLATGGFTFIMVEWDKPTFAGFAYAEVWRSPANDFGTAVRVATTQATIYIDPVELESEYYYWVRFVNVNDVAGPIHATSGVFAETARDINKVRQALLDVITETQLASNLKTRIDLVDAGAEITGSVNARIAAEAAARGLDIDAVYSAILSEQTSRQSADSALANDITLVIASVDDNTAAILTEQTARADADSALSTSITLLSAEVDGNAAAISSEQTARADGDSALASSITSLAATVDSNSAAIISEQTARSDADSALASDISSLTTTVNGNTASISTIQSSVDGLSVEYMVKLDVNGYVTGFGQYNQGPGASGFLIHTDYFAVGQPGQSTKYPFIIGTVNGVTTIVLDGATFIADATITNAKIANLAVDSAKIADLAVGAAKIAAAAITTAKIDDLAVTAAKIALLAVGTAHITDAAITSAKIGDAEVGTLKIANEAVTVPAGSSIYYGGFIPDSWITIDYVDVNWGGNPPAAVMVSAFCNYEPQSGDSLSVALRVAVSINGGADITAGDVGLSAVNGYSVIANTSWRFTGQSGSCRYKIQVFASTGGKYKAGGCGITVLGVRR